MDLPQILDVLSRGSITAFLALMFWTIATDRLVTKGRLQDCQRERDRAIAEEAEARERAEDRAAAAERDRVRIIADRDRLRMILEEHRREVM